MVFEILVLARFEILAHCISIGKISKSSVIACENTSKGKSSRKTLESGQERLKHLGRKIMIMLDSI